MFLAIGCSSVGTKGGGGGVGFGAPGADGEGGGVSGIGGVGATARSGVKTMVGEGVNSGGVFNL